MGIKPAGNFKVPVAVAFSAFDKKINLIIREALIKRRWKLQGTHDVDRECFAVLVSGKASLLIIDDSIGIPANFALREQIFQTVPLLTPTIVICSEHNAADVECMMTMGAPIVIRKPLTLTKFLEAFDQLIQRWSQAPFTLFRSAANYFVEGHSQKAYSLLGELVRGQPHHIASAAMSLHFRHKNDLLMAENFLYKALKAGHHQMTVILPLIDLYLFSASPSKALKLIQQAMKDYRNPNLLCVDAIQAHILLNQIRESIPYITQMIENDYFADVGRFLLPRIAYSAGMMDLFDKAIRYRPDRFDEYQRAWHNLTDADAKRRLAQYEEIALSKKLKEKEERLKINSSEGIHLKKSLTIDQSKYEEIGKPLFQREKAK